MKISLDNHGLTENFVAVIVLFFNCFFFLFEECSIKSFTMTRLLLFQEHYC